MDKFFGLDAATLKDRDLELLTSANDRVYLSIVESILQDNQIPYLVKDRGCGTLVKVVMGYSIFGADVFVLKDDFAKASELMEQFPTDADNEDTEEEQ